MFRKETAELNEQLRCAEASLQAEEAAHEQMRAALQSETITRHTVEQQVVGLKERLADHDNHRQSLEEKHRHARDALEHYRQSVKEQRDLEQRRHEQQIQQLQTELRQTQQTMIIKQGDLTRLNQDATRLVAELSHTQTAFHEEQNHNRRLMQKLEALQAAERRAKTLEAHITDKNLLLSDWKHQRTEAAKQIAAWNAQVHSLQLELAAAQAKLETQQSIAAELRAYTERQEELKRENVQISKAESCT